MLLNPLLGIAKPLITNNIDTMKKPFIHQIIFFLLIFIFSISNAQERFDTPYGKNNNVGKYAKINGIKMYYEEYGKGEPLLLIHGNGADIRSMANQIDYFKSKYRIIVADSRGHGKSELNTDSLTYVQIAKDWDGLVKYLKLDSINIIGWSDGGIVALKMGICSNSKIKKIVTMGANLRPDTTAFHSWLIKKYIIEEREMVESKILEKDTTQNWNLKKQLLGLLGDQPNIPIEDLSLIKAKVLIMAGDEDAIRGEHSLEIYEHIPKAQLCIMPGETHFTPVTNPELFNAIVNRFLSEPFKRPYSK